MIKLFYIASNLQIPLEYNAIALLFIICHQQLYIRTLNSNLVQPSGTQCRNYFLSHKKKKKKKKHISLKGDLRFACGYKSNK